ncbi:hypothetical protein PsAD2_01930 [Pseudovibrio axinellae]|uniref:Uncharacterized protein n=1 Tax=Pseudovibrio axinellae TaxID=989403 RepID=A0A165ZAF4_9HYPH|nr:hypothetical protein [Pseudovibrio axinellae]KZL19651.1 hypothetical protein PsAD2_01930 [Pseudovibrio axinellae]SEQ35541.1 hypothetical protein SAMN05421798_102491 [Pseudovibrio axinellae]
MKNIVVLAAFCFALIPTPIAQAESNASEKWAAFSTTAMSITGDIEVSPTAITMSTGSVLPIEAVKGDIPHLYRFTGADKLKLIRDNSFCMTNTTDGYIVLSYPTADELSMNVFQGDSPPVSDSNLDSQPNLCAIYNYQKPQAE